MGCDLPAQFHARVTVKPEVDPAFDPRKTLLPRPTPRAAAGGAWGARVAILAGGVTFVLGINMFVRELGIAQPPAAIVLAESAAV